MSDTEQRPAVDPDVFVSAGPIEASRLPAASMGFWVTSGMLLRGTALGQAVSTELLGPGDLFMPVDLDPPVGVAVGSVALTDVALLALDEGMARRSPEVLAAIIARAGGQARRAAHHRTLAQLPRVPDRLVALFWMIGEHWGTITPDGVLGGLRLEPETIAALVGASTASVLQAMDELAQTGVLVLDEAGEWRLDPSSKDRLIG